MYRFFLTASLFALSATVHAAPQAFSMTGDALPNRSGGIQAIQMPTSLGGGASAAAVPAVVSKPAVSVQGAGYSPQSEGFASGSSGSAAYAPSGGAAYQSMDSAKTAASNEAYAKNAAAQTPAKQTGGDGEAMETAAKDAKSEAEKKAEKEKDDKEKACKAATEKAAARDSAGAEKDMQKSCDSADYTKTQVADAKPAASESAPTIEMSKAQLDGYKQYAESMMNYEQKNLAGRPGLENVPTKVPMAFPTEEDGAKAGYKFTSGYGARESPCSGCSSFHQGNDYSLKDASGTPDANKKIATSAQGKVVQAQYIKGYGNTVTVDHGRYKTQYSHLDSMAVKVGDTVGVGQVVGVGGSSGVGTAAHLHYGMMDEQASTKYIDPLTRNVTPVANNTAYSVAEGGSKSALELIGINSSGNYGGNGTNSGLGTGVPVASAGTGGGVVAGRVTNTNGDALLGKVSTNPVEQIMGTLFGGTTGSSGGLDSLMNQALGGLTGGMNGGGATSGLAAVLAQVAVQKLMGGGQESSGGGSSYNDSSAGYETADAATMEQLNSYVALRQLAQRCGTDLPSSADAIMLMVKSCQG